MLLHKVKFLAVLVAFIALCVYFEKTGIVVVSGTGSPHSDLEHGWWLTDYLISAILALGFVAALVALVVAGLVRLIYVAANIDQLDEDYR
jgi:ABC-type Fe3+ transport system permease subunit